MTTPSKTPWITCSWGWRNGTRTISWCGNTRNIGIYFDNKSKPKIAHNQGTEREFLEKALLIKAKIQQRLWDKNENFFKVIPLASKNAKVESWSFNEILPDHNVKEEIGFIPWYFEPPDEGFDAAWKYLMNPDYFRAPYGPTTAEKKHPKFMYQCAYHECLWNGPSWPFATAQTLTAMANLLNDYSQTSIDGNDYFDLLSTYAKSHYRITEQHQRISWIDENLDPVSGQWLSRKILESWSWKPDLGGKERGRHYNHSTFCDLIITGLIGLRPDERDMLTINPFIPMGHWAYFCMDEIPYHGHLITILYDESGGHYGKGKGLQIFTDGRLLKPEIKNNKYLIFLS